MATNEMVEKEEGQVVEFDSSIFEDDAMDEKLGKDDLAIPFLKVASRQDDQLDELVGANVGDIYNSVTYQVYSGATGMKVIPCHYERRFLEWVPRGQGTGAPVSIYKPDVERPITARDKENVDWVVGGESYIEETHQHYVVVLEEDGSFSTGLIAMKKTQLKKSRKWNSMITTRTLVGKKGPYTPARYSHIYHVKTIAEKNAKGSWHGWDISLDRQVSDINLYNAAKAFAETVSAGDVEVRYNADSGDGDGDNSPF